MQVIKPGEDRDVPRGVVAGAEISQATAGARNIYMGVFRVPAGARSRPHYHAGCESAVYMLSGSLRVRWGDRLERELTLEPGDLSTSRRGRRTCWRTCPTASRPSTWWPATHRTRTRWSSRGPTRPPSHTPSAAASNIGRAALQSLPGAVDLRANQSTCRQVGKPGVSRGRKARGLPREIARPPAPREGLHARCYGWRQRTEVGRAVAGSCGAGFTPLCAGGWAWWRCWRWSPPGC